MTSYKPLIYELMYGSIHFHCPGIRIDFTYSYTTKYFECEVKSCLVGCWLQLFLCRVNINHSIQSTI